MKKNGTFIIDIIPYRLIVIDFEII